MSMQQNETSPRKTATHLELPKGLKIALQVFIAITVIFGLSIYTFGTFKWVEYLNDGFTGLWCQGECIYAPDTQELIVAENSPADLAGVHDGDILLSVEGRSFDELAEVALDFDFDFGPYGEAIPGGTPGEDVTITVRHEDGLVEEITFTQAEGWNELVAGFTMIGLPLSLGIFANVSSQVIYVLGFAALGLFLVWQADDDWMMLSVGFMLLILAFTNDTSPRNFADINMPALLRVILNIYDHATPFFIMFFFFGFPNGKIVPRWATTLIGIYAFYYFIGLNVVFLPLIAASPKATKPEWLVPIDSLLFYGGLLFGLGSQVYRYFKVSSPEQKQQTKLILFSLAFGLGIFFLRLAWPSPYKSNVSDLNLLAWTLVATISFILQIITPIFWVISLKKYRLWDLDFVINRSMVYGGMTALLILLFGGALLVIPVIFDTISGGQQSIIAIAAATMIFGASFQPVRRFLQRMIDKHIYNIQIDYQNAAQSGGDFFGGGSLGERSTKTTSLGEFSNLKLIGRGGMAEVYRATHPTINGPVAIKVMPPSQNADDQYVERFQREAKIVSTLRHPNIIKLFEMGETDGVRYMVMEYIDGQELSGLLDEYNGKLPLTIAIPIMKDIANALDYAHSHGLVHRDVKPSNIMVETIRKPTDDRLYRVILMDFGIAKMSDTNRFTQTGMLGTFDYMAPEQIQASGEIDGRADVYALGVMIYQLLTGELPFKHHNPGAVLMAHLMQPPPNLRKIAPEIPEETALAVMKAMSKKADSRFDTASGFVASLFVA